MSVTVYTKDDCRQCDLTKTVLRREGIDFTEADLTEPGNLEAAKSLGYLAAPVVVAGDEHWAGFQPDRIKALVAQIEGA